MTTKTNANSSRSWVIAYYYGESEMPLCYLGTPSCPAVFTEVEAREEAARLNTEIINMAGKDASVDGLQVWRYAALPKDCKTQSNKETLCDHEWVVFSTALTEVCLMLQCVNCGAHGSVDDPTSEEWSEAFDAPSQPYRWTENDRVNVRGVLPPEKWYVRKGRNGDEDQRFGTRPMTDSD